MFLSKKKKSKIWYSGNFASWEIARSRSVGYESPQILERVLDAAVRVAMGSYAYEQDGCLFKEQSCPSCVLAAFNLCMSDESGSIKVLDWGGSLGSMYFRAKPFLSHYNNIEWQVVEQPNFVSAGKQSLSIDELKFSTEITGNNYNLAFFSSVLQFLPAPYEVIDEVVKRGADNILISRTPFMGKSGNERITIQEVFPPLYEASYPCRFLDESKLLSKLNSHNYNLVFSETDGDVRPNIKKSRYRNLLFTKAIDDSYITSPY